MILFIIIWLLCSAFTTFTLLRITANDNSQLTLADITVVPILSLLVGPCGAVFSIIYWLFCSADCIWHKLDEVIIYRRSL